ncbi:KTSC domain-containing protein [Desertivirga arenae]|uniref:KTSC domain-containing protein n=1 Tax=Desertivirga arenae TaxID=2810309 RepID=UPI001A963A90|nr:KTSC domain-containing protein [Pedobacter sp. SYSU D00823]
MAKAETGERLLNTDQKIITSASQTTLYVDYSVKEEILEVAYRPDKIYHYFNVKRKVWQDYKNTVEAGESSGQFVNFRIKPFYKFDRIV